MIVVDLAKKNQSLNVGAFKRDTKTSVIYYRLYFTRKRGYLVVASSGGVLVTAIFGNSDGGNRWVNGDGMLRSGSVLDLGDGNGVSHTDSDSLLSDISSDAGDRGLGNVGSDGRSCHSRAGADEEQRCSYTGWLLFSDSLGMFRWWSWSSIGCDWSWDWNWSVADWWLGIYSWLDTFRGHRMSDRLVSSCCICGERVCCANLSGTVLVDRSWARNVLG